MRYGLSPALRRGTALPKLGLDRWIRLVFALSKFPFCLLWGACDRGLAIASKQMIPASSASKRPRPKVPTDEIVLVARYRMPAIASSWYMLSVVESGL